LPIRHLIDLSQSIPQAVFLMTYKIEKLTKALAMEWMAAGTEHLHYSTMILQLETYLAQRRPKPSDELINEWSHTLDAGSIATPLSARQWW
jgi:hypothetical protein